MRAARLAKSRARSRVLLVDDHAPTLAHVARVVEREFTVAGTMTSSEWLLAEWSSAQADVIVLDIGLPQVSGFEAAARLRARGCRAPIVFLSVHESPEVVRAAWLAGGIAYVAKRDFGVDLVPAIHAALRGEHFVSAAIEAAEPLSRRS